jgi:nucleotide-binding universal stress UspA family protein
LGPTDGSVAWARSTEAANGPTEAAEGPKRRERGVSSFEVVLLAVDKSEQSDRAVEVARDLARLSGGVVHLLHVLEREVVVARGGGAFDLETEEDVEALVSKELSVLREAGVEVEVDIRRGRLDVTYRAILQVADDISADVIVMGSRGLTAFGALMLGSHTYRVLHASTRPVLVVP